MRSWRSCQMGSTVGMCPTGPQYEYQLILRLLDSFTQASQPYKIGLPSIMFLECQFGGSIHTSYNCSEPNNNLDVQTCLITLLYFTMLRPNTFLYSMLYSGPGLLALHPGIGRYTRHPYDAPPPGTLPQSPSIET